mmetsp:Transcript_29337/g.75628  ORF Transcript_29337/g.75628 Transcript_29337/m.75628 type:complete len:207 (-) Transcript_29337:585-1205(-)
MGVRDNLASVRCLKWSIGIVHFQSSSLFPESERFSRAAKSPSSASTSVSLLSLRMSFFRFGNFANVATSLHSLISFPSMSITFTLASAALTMSAASDRLVSWLFAMCNASSWGKRVHAVHTCLKESPVRLRAITFSCDSGEASTGKAAGNDIRQRFSCNALSVGKARPSFSTSIQSENSECDTSNSSNTFNFSAVSSAFPTFPAFE